MKLKEQFSTTEIRDLTESKALKALNYPYRKALDKKNKYKKRSRKYIIKKTYFKDEADFYEYLKDIVEKLGFFPTKDYIDDNRMCDANINGDFALCCLNYNIGKKGFEYWRAKFGLEPLTRKDALTEAQIKKELWTLIDKVGRFPYVVDIKNSGVTGLMQQVSRTGGIARWRDELNFMPLWKERKMNKKKTTAEIKRENKELRKKVYGDKKINPEFFEKKR